MWRSWLCVLATAACLSIAEGAAADYSNAIFELPQESSQQQSLPQPIPRQSYAPNQGVSQRIEGQLDAIKAPVLDRQKRIVARDRRAPTCESGLCHLLFGRSLSEAEAAEAADAEDLAAFSAQVASQTGTRDAATLAAVATEENGAIRERCKRLRSHLLCVASRHRHPDGRCNNVEQPWLGSSGDPLRRRSPANYADGIGSLASHLPSPASLANLFAGAEEKERVASGLSLLFPSWAHLLRDDVLELSHWKRGGRDCLNCKTGRGAHSQCLDFLHSDAHCGVSYTRLVAGVESDCRLGPRSPANLATAALDASVLYGSQKSSQASLRVGERGLLKGRGGLPPRRGASNCVGRRPCLAFGNLHSNLAPNTGAMVGLLHATHNNVAARLARLNPHWNDEDTFAAARRFVEAALQHVTYAEYLPLLLGRDVLQASGLGLSDAFSHAYKETKGAGLGTTVEAAQALAFYQSMLSDRVYASERGKIFFRPEALGTKQRRQELWARMLAEAPQRVGLHLGQRFHRELLHRRLPNGAGSIAAAILLQQGRDAGTGAYVEWRRRCRLPVPGTLEDLITHSDIAPAEYRRIKAAYARVEDVDLLVGALAESAAPGAQVGTTLQCILAAHYADVKNSDRFWYENYMFPSALSTQQVSEVKKISLAWLICQAGLAGSVQPRAFLAADDFDNARLSCDALAGPDFAAWLEPSTPPRHPINRALVEKSLRLAQASVAEERRQKGESLPRRDSAAFFHYLITRADKNTIRVARIAQVLLEATRLFFTYSEELENPPKEIPQERLQELLPQVDVSEVMSLLGEDKCRTRAWPCDHESRYRRFDGWCNNLRFPEFGTAGRALGRLLSPAYEDGFNAPRRLGTNGRPLPSARAVSNAVHGIPRPNHARYSHMLMQWGQFLDHDFALSPISLDANNAPLNCEACDSAQSVSQNCFPIPVPRNDPFFPQRNRDGSPKCLPFARSIVGQLRLGYREQMNQITAFIDASNIYGADECLARELRQGERGLLKEQGGALLPVHADNHDCRSSPSHHCFLAGDERVNEQAGLGTIHTLSMRAHNDLARRLADLNPHWDDERLYQESRRIMSAVAQHITYKEWLPKILGRAAVQRMGLESLEGGYYQDYDEKCDAGISNVFATAAFRFGHTLVQGRMAMMDAASSEPNGHQNIVNLFFNVSLLYDKKVMSDLFRGFTRQPCGAFDSTLDPQLRDRLFEERNRPKSGLDLAALNIQRGRDHGLPSYTEYRRALKLSPIRSWADLEGLMDSAVLGPLRSVYAAPADIDVFTGIVSERRREGAVVGDTLAAILGEQFRRLRKCDRFWYENGGQAGSFTPAQLAQIRKTSLAWLVCQNMERMEVQTDVFAQLDETENVPVPCAAIAKPDLEPWTDHSQGCRVGGASVDLGSSVEVSPCVSCTCTSEGIRCHSFRVPSCPRLISQHSRDEVLADPACLAQCHVFLSQSSPLRPH